MRQRKETFGESVADVAALVVGGFVGLWAAKGLYEGGKLIVKEGSAALAERQKLRASNPEEFDRPIIETMRLYNWDTPQAQQYWSIAKVGLYPFECARIEAKIRDARMWDRPLPVASLTNKPARTTAKRGKKRKSSRARSVFARPVTRRELNAAPPAIETVARVERCAPAVLPVETAAPVKVTKKTERRGVAGRKADETRERLLYFCELRLEKHLSVKAALERTAARFDDGTKKVGAVLRAVRRAVSKHLDGGHDEAKLQRFTAEVSKMVNSSKMVKKTKK